ncbi:MAG: ATP-binding protein, partial [Bacteroidia bacterium]
GKFSSFKDDPSPYGKLICKYDFNFEERLVLILSLVIHVQPKIVDLLKKESMPTSFGGIIGKNHRGFIPTGETLMFILAGNDVKKRLELLYLFDKEHVFYKDNLVYLEPPLPSEPELSGVLTASQDLIDLVLRGKVGKPDLRIDFPAKLLSTEMNWDDIVLPTSTFNQLNEIELWIEHSQQLAADSVIGKKLKPGFRALFYGPPGTGKTLSACLIGKKTGRDVYRVDLSTIVSKYIGETEKNLAKLFDRASRKDWILFFDEADALFGKRTNVNDSHDRYANQEVSYLLQRIEYHEGLVILATNLKNNIDSAFLRRFQSIVYFPMPKVEERILLWKKAFSEHIPADDSIVLSEIAKKYELSGSLILNIVSHCTLRALNEKSKVITANMLQDGIARELAKEGRTL